MMWNSSEMPLPPCMSRASRAMSSALPQLLRFINDTDGGAAVPASIMRPRRSAPLSPMAISVCMSASFFCTSWFAASGRLNCFLSSAYCRARCQQNSAAPIAPQEMPKRALLRQPNGPARPFTFGSRFSSGTRQSSSTISPVIDARSDNLPSIFGVEKPLVPRSTRKPRMTLSSFAQTTATCATGAFEIARDQSVGDIAKTGTAVLFRNGWAEQAELAHLRQQARIVFFVAIGFHHTWGEVTLRKPARGVAHHALFFGKLAFKIERVFPHERCVFQHCGHTTALLGHLRHEASLWLFALL